jgi:hypothetical protein
MEARRIQLPLLLTVGSALAPIIGRAGASFRGLDVDFDQSEGSTLLGK